MERCGWVSQDQLYIDYHDREWGVPETEGRKLFEMICLEGQQAGLSWITVLKKRENYRNAFHQFDPVAVAAMTDEDVERLVQDAGIIRNRLKIEATIHNAKCIKVIQKEFGSFKNWLDKNHPKIKEEWVKLFKQTFRFTGGEIVNEFLMSTGYLPGAHSETCPVYKKVLKQKPKWLTKK